MPAKFNPLIFSGIDLTGASIPPSGAVEWKSPVATEAALPTVGNTDGDARVALDTDKIYVWDATTSKWIDSKLTTAAFGATPNADGLTVSSVTVGDITRATINLEPADATNPGAVSTTAQTFAGDKTFNDNIIVEGSIDAKGGIDSSTNTLTIGATADFINIGGAGATITINGDTTYEHVTDLVVKDKTITLNDGGGLASGANSGIEVEENSVITGYAQVSSDRNAWELKAPNQAGVAVIDAGAAGITIDQSSHDPVTIAAIPNGLSLTGQELSIAEASAVDTGVVTTGIQTFAGDKTFNDNVAFVDVIDVQTGIDSTTGTLTLGGINTTTVNIGEPATGITSAIFYGVTDHSGYDITNFGQLSTSPTGNQAVITTVTSSSTNPDYSGLIFSEANPEQADILYTAGGTLNLNSSQNLALTAPNFNVDSANVDIGQIGGTTDIIGTVTIEYNPADPTDWAPAPTHVIEAIDQLAERFVEQDQVTNEPTGFPNRTDSVILFNDGGGTPTFTIQPAVTSYDVYIRGKKYTKTAAETVTTVSHLSFPYAGNNYFYFDQNGDLQVTNTFTAAIIQQYAFISVVYWNPDTNSHTYFAEERHGLTMDGVTHSYLHTVLGARYLSGLALQNFTIGTGGANADAQFDVDQGSIRDEDILLQIAAQPQIPILYRLGSNSYWRKKTADSFPLIYSGTAGYTGANGRLPYNQFSGGSWSLTEVANNKYVLVHFFATNDKENGVVGIQGIAEYDSMEAARTGANNEISSLSGLPFAEFVPIGTVLFQTANTFTNTPKADVIPVDGANYVDFRGTQLYTPAGTATTHGLLSGLGNDDHFQYLLADGTRAMSGALDMGTHQINNVVDPTLSDDAATKNYVDNEVSNATTGTPSFFAGFDAITGVLTEVPGYTFDDNGTLQIGAQNSLTVPAGVTDYISIGISPTIANTGLDNLTAIQVNSPINQPVDSYTPIQVYGYGTSAPTNFNAYNSQTNYTGVGTNITHYLASGSSDCTGDAIAFRHDGSGDAGTIKSVQLVPSGDATTIEGVSFVPSGSYTDATGLKVDLSSATITNRPVGLDITGGTLSSNVSFTTVSNIPILVDSGNVIRPVFEVETGSAITNTDVILNNMAGFMNFNDDYNKNITTGLGAASVGFVSQVAAASGALVEDISMSLAGLSIDSTSAGGTITDAHLYKGSVLDIGGGSLSITNLYGLRIDDGSNVLSSNATNAWGISIEDTGAENYLAKSLKIGGVSKATSNAEIALEIGSNKSIRVGLATTAQRIALTNLSGLVIYDTDLDKFFGNDGSQWIQLNLSIGDIDQTSFPAADNQSSAANITSFVFANAVTRGFEAIVTVERSSTYAEYTLKGIQKGASWEMSQDYIGDDTGIVFSITSAGQIQYTSTNTGSGATIKFRANTV